MFETTTVDVSGLTQRIVDFFAEALGDGQPHSVDSGKRSYRYAATREELDVEGQQRLRNCGKFYSSINPYTGRQQSGRFYCEMFRLCPACRNRRLIEQRNAVDQALVDGPVSYWGRVTAKQRRALTRQLSKFEYRVFPVAGEGDEWADVFTRPVEKTPEGCDAQPVTPEFIAAYDWATAVQTPPGRNISGKLGEFCREAVGGEGEEVATAAVVVQHFITNATLEQEHEALAEALAETVDLDPHTEIELQQALTVRQEAYSAALHRRGRISVYSYSKYITVNLPRVNWQADRKAGPKPASELASDFFFLSV